jgi:enoyl-CoA hydratase
MIFTGDAVEAQKALEWGLADEVVEGDVLDRALEQASRYAAGPTVSLAAAKVAINRATSADLAAGLALELDEFTKLFSTEDTRHGIESFLNEGPGKAKFEGK